MIDRKKAIKGLQQCTLNANAEAYETQCHDCPYFDQDSTVAECVESLKDDILALLTDGGGKQQ